MAERVLSNANGGNVPDPTPTDLPPKWMCTCPTEVQSVRWPGTDIERGRERVRVSTAKGCPVHDPNHLPDG